MFSFNIIFHGHEIGTIRRLKTENDDYDLEITPPSQPISILYYVAFMKKCHIDEVFVIVGRKDLFFPRILDLLEYIEHGTKI